MSKLTQYDPCVTVADHVTAILTKLGHPAPNDWRTSVTPGGLSAQSTPEVQRYFINIGLRMYLGRFQESTTDARFCLVDTGELKDWLRLFETGVAPCMINHTRPKNN